MAHRWPGVFAAALLLAAASSSVSASGLFMVTRKGVPAYEEAKNGFIQTAYMRQIKGFSPSVLELDGTERDDAALSALKSQSPDLVFALGAYAAKRVRHVLPEVPVVYTMVYYPETEGLTKDSKATGVYSLGSPRLLAQAAKSLGKVRSLVVLHHQSIAADAQSIAALLASEGVPATPRSLKGPEELQKAVDELRNSAQAVLLLPDPITQDPQSLRFIISKCVESGVLPLAYGESLVSNGALFASFIPPEAAGRRAAEEAALLLASGKPPEQRLVAPADASTALNRSTATALRLKVPKELSSGTIYE